MLRQHKPQGLQSHEDNTDPGILLLEILDIVCAWHQYAIMFLLIIEYPVRVNVLRSQYLRAELCDVWPREQVIALKEKYQQKVN